MAYTLIDTGPIVAYYNSGDSWHFSVMEFLERFSGQLATTCVVVGEVMYLLRSDQRAQNELLSDLSKGLYKVVSLEPADFARIVELNIKYKNLPGDFADLSLIAISERLDIRNIVSLDADFDICRRYHKNKFNQVFLRNQ